MRRLRRSTAGSQARRGSRDRNVRAARDLGGLPLVLFHFERIDEINGREEADTLFMVLDGLDANRRGEMRLARAGPADQDGVVSVLQELAAM